MSNTKEFTRQEIYEPRLVHPIVKLAKEFGLSEHGFPKDLHSPEHVQRGRPLAPIAWLSTDR